VAPGEQADDAQVRAGGAVLVKPLMQRAIRGEQADSQQQESEQTSKGRFCNAAKAATYSSQSHVMSDNKHHGRAARKRICRQLVSLRLPIVTSGF
jgi:hypothetical protein